MGVAIHAGLGAWNIGVGGFFNPGVTVATIHSKLIDVKGVVESDRLGGLVADASVFWGEIVGHARNYACPYYGKTNQNFDW